MDASAGQTEAQIGLEYDIIRRQVRLNYYEYKFTYNYKYSVIYKYKGRIQNMGGLVTG